MKETYRLTEEEFKSYNEMWEKIRKCARREMYLGEEYWECNGGRVWYHYSQHQINPKYGHIVTKNDRDILEITYNKKGCNPLSGIGYVFWTIEGIDSTKWVLNDKRIDQFKRNLDKYFLPPENGEDNGIVSKIVE